MARKTILLIAEDHKTAASIKEILGHQFHLEIVKGSKPAITAIEKKTPDLIIIDFDLRGEDGLQIFKELGTTVKVIMLSVSGSIPLAVSATKQGIAEFLRKPVDPEQLKKAVEINIAKEEIKLHWTDEMEWLKGGGPALKRMFDAIQAALRENKDIILFGERGIPKDVVAEFVHNNGPKKESRIAKVDVASFRKETLEAHFWATIQELMSLPKADSIQDEEDRCGTIYLNNIGNLDELFRLSIFNFFSGRRKSIRVIIGINDKNEIPKLKLKGFAEIVVPPLRERKEDLPHLLRLHLKRYSEKYGKSVAFISRELLDFLAAYDYPGNYAELERVIENAVLAASSNNLEVDNFPFDYQGLLCAAQKKGLEENLTLEEAQKHFEKELYYILLKKTKGDSSKVARFLDVPKTVLAERIEDLLD
ncbi:MAG: response regulator [Candidatus Margulisiibacteriota bacterium]